MPKPVVSSMPDTQVVPDAMLKKRTRRQFSTEYKLRIISQADSTRQMAGTEWPHFRGTKTRSDGSQKEN
jgi:hypothetical protein